MIKTDSPYYVTIPWNYYGSIPDSYVFKMFVWSGTKASIPTTPIVEIEKVNYFNLDTDTDIDISDFINGEIPFTLNNSSTTSLIDADSQVWVFYQVLYTVGGVVSSPILNITKLATRGYGYGNEGANTETPINGLMTAPIEYKVNRAGGCIIPFEASETITTEIELIAESGDVLFSKVATTEANELVQSLYIDLADYPNDDYIELNYNGVLVNTILIQDEQRYTPLDVAFRNKEGQLQTFTFFKEKRDNVTFANESYQSGFGQPKDGVHQFVDYNINGKEVFIINTGWVNEDNNEIIQQLLLSSLLWIVKDGDYTPINRTQKVFDKQTRQKERLINYELGFTYSYNLKNNV